MGKKPGRADDEWREARGGGVGGEKMGPPLSCLLDREDEVLEHETVGDEEIERRRRILTEKQNVLKFVLVSGSERERREERKKSEDCREEEGESFMKRRKKTGRGLEGRSCLCFLCPLSGPS